LLPYAIDGQFPDLWLGANRGADPTSWRWVTGEPFAFTAWSAGAPQGDGDCLEVIGQPSGGANYGRWNDELVYAWGGGQYSILEWDVGVATESDCNANGIPDSCEIASGSVGDCDNDGIPNSCEIAAGAPDCNNNGIPDACDIASGLSRDVDEDGKPDECEFDCNRNGLPDDYDIATSASADCNRNGIPDECEDGSMSAAGHRRDLGADGLPPEMMLSKQFGAGRVTVRRALDGEELLALDGKTYALNARDCVIADDSGAVGIGGVMGGAHTGVGDDQRPAHASAGALVAQEAHHAGVDIDLGQVEDAGHGGGCQRLRVAKVCSGRTCPPTC
jgi:hypothetical protein